MSILFFAWYAIFRFSLVAILWFSEFLCFFSIVFVLLFGLVRFAISEFTHLCLLCNIIPNNNVRHIVTVTFLLLYKAHVHFIYEILSNHNNFKILCVCGFHIVAVIDFLSRLKALCSMNHVCYIFLLVIILQSHDFVYYSMLWWYFLFLCRIHFFFIQKNDSFLALETIEFYFPFYILLSHFDLICLHKTQIFFLFRFVC